MPKPKRTTQRVTATEEAEDWLRERLSAGAVLSRDLVEEWTGKRGLSKKPLYTAAKNLRVIIRAAGKQSTTWELPNG